MIIIQRNECFGELTCMTAATQKLQGRPIQRGDLDLVSVDRRNQESSPPSPG